MYSFEDILFILIYLCVAVWVTAILIKYMRLTPQKVVWFGMSLMVFINTILEEKTTTNLNEIFSILGLGLVIGGLISRGHHKEEE